MEQAETPGGSEEAAERESELIKVRRSKLQRIIEGGAEPFKSLYKSPEEIALSGGLHDRFADLEPGSGSGENVSVAGRLMARREHGKATFADLSDSEGKIQLILRQDLLGEEAYRECLDLDIGDWVGASGEVVRSKRGELSIAVDSIELLSKSLRPLPEKWHGLKDRETRYRQRYLDLLMNPEARRVLEARTAVVRELRRFLDDRGFIEVETPMLQPVPGGATARPFMTHHNALGMDLYLRIAPELYLKRLLVGGYTRVYEINRNFRNEGMSARHSPEFTMLEAYEAFVDYRYLMDFLEEMISTVVERVHGAGELEFAGEPISMSGPWKRLTMLEALSEYAGIDADLETDPSRLRSISRDNEVEVPPGAGPGWMIAELYEKLVEPRLIQPTFVVDYPEEISPLARGKKGAPGLTERFEILIAGQEIANAFSELTDPVEQRRRFEQQAAKAAAGDEEAHRVDEDFLAALEYGMPPAGGIGVGVDRLTMLVTGCQNIRDVIVFPHLRPREGRSTP
jgi:lysyl-tRNA synthetase class 2